LLSASLPNLVSYIVSLACKLIAMDPLHIDCYQLGANITILPLLSQRATLLAFGIHQFKQGPRRDAQGSSQRGNTRLGRQTAAIDPIAEGIWSHANFLGRSYF
jgi:hypothetical protein